MFEKNALGHCISQGSLRNGINGMCSCSRVFVTMYVCIYNNLFIYLL